MIARAARWIFAAGQGAAAVVQTVAGRFITMGINLVTGVLVARSLGAYGRGVQAALVLWPQLLCYFLTLGISFGLIYHVRRKSDDDGQLVAVAMILGLVTGTLAAIIGVIGIPHWIGQYGPAVVAEGRGLMIFAPVCMLSFMANAFFESRLNFSASNIIRYLPAGLTLVTLIALFLTHTFTPYTAALAYVAPSALTLVVVAPRILRVMRLDLRRFGATAGLLLTYGIRVYGAEILTTCSTQIDQMIIVGMLSPASLGLYTVALSASRVLMVFQTSLTVVLLPKMSDLQTDEIVVAVGRLARITGTITLACALVLAALTPWLLHALYGESFQPAVVVTQILMFEAVLGSVAGVLTQAFLAGGRPGVVSILQALGLAVAVPLMIYGVPRYGLTGAAVALTVSTTIRLVSILAAYPMLLARRAPGLVLGGGDVKFLIGHLRGAFIEG